MSGHDRRAQDKRIVEMHGDIKEIKNILQGEQGVCVRLSVCERSNEAIQKELTDHKDNHRENKQNNFRLIDIVLAIGMFFIGALEWLRR